MFGCRACDFDLCKRCAGCDNNPRWHEIMRATTATSSVAQSKVAAASRLPPLPPLPAIGMDGLRDDSESWPEEVLPPLPPLPPLPVSAHEPGSPGRASPGSWDGGSWPSTPREGRAGDVSWPSTPRGYLPPDTSDLPPPIALPLPALQPNMAAHFSIATPREFSIATPRDIGVAPLPPGVMEADFSEELGLSPRDLLASLAPVEELAPPAPLGRLELPPQAPPAVTWITRTVSLLRDIVCPTGPREPELEVLEEDDDLCGLEWSVVTFAFLFWGVIMLQYLPLLLVGIYVMLALVGLYM